MPSFLRRSTHASTGVILGRADFYARVNELIASDGGNRYGIALIHLSHLKSYNLLVGLEESDQVTEAIVGSLVAHLGRKAFVANPSQEEYLVPALVEDIDALLAGVKATLATCAGTEGITVKIGCCAVYPGCDARALTERARFAYEQIHYDATQELRLYDSEIAPAFERRRYVIDHLDDAIQRGEIKVYVQPIVHVITGRVCEVEILARWENERFGLISPTDFVPQLERFRLIHKLDATVARLACAQWYAAKQLGVAVPFGINLSRLDFDLCDIYEVVRGAMRQYDVPVDMVHIEVTESAATGSREQLRRGIRRFREAGFKIYMDDFGTGYSSLEGLRDSDYDVVKLDMSLIRDVETNERSRVVAAEAIILAKRLNMQTLCEGVENVEQLRYLRMVGCEKAQGYFFGRPTSHEVMLKRLQQEAERYSEPGYAAYVDEVGRVNLIDGTRASVQGVEAGIFFSDAPVAVCEVWDQRVVCLASNAAFVPLLARIGVRSFEELIGTISSGTGEMRKRLAVATRRAKETGQRQSIDFIAGGFFSVVSIEHVASTTERDAYLFMLSSINSSGAIERERTLEIISPFLYSVYKRIDLFDLTSGTSRNVYLSTPLLRSHRMAGITNSEIREFCDRNVHPADRRRFLDFYDLATLDERVMWSGGNYDSAVLRTRIAEDAFEYHIYTLIPMTIEGKRHVVSTLRPLDVELRSSTKVSGAEGIPDETLLRAVLEGTDRYVFWKDRERRFLGCNDAFLEYFGFKSLQEILGKTDEDLGWHVDDEPFREDELRVLKGEVVLRARGYCYDRNELRRIEANKRPIVVDSEVVGLLGYFRDLGPVEEE